jgi:hypothetical protein
VGKAAGHEVGGHDRQGELAMVPFVGVFTSLLVSLAVQIYLRYFNTLGPRYPGFERWCEGRPLVVAFFCPREGAADLARWLGEALRVQREHINTEGPCPWPFYRLRLEAHVYNECVVGITIRGQAQAKDHQVRPPVLALVQRACAAVAGVEEVWVHRDLHASEEECEPHMSWRGRPSATGPLPLRAYSELPFWLRPFDGKGPPSRRRDAEAVAADWSLAPTR